MSSKKKPMRLADKISDLITAAPKIIDSDDDCEETRAKVVDFDDEIDEQDNFQEELKSTNIRRRNVGLLEETDKRYAGKKVSKKDIFDDGLSSGGSSNEDLEEDDSDETDGSDKEDEGFEIEENGSVASDDEEDRSDDENQEGSDEEEVDKDTGSNDEDDESDVDDMDDSIDLSNPLRRERDTEDSIKTLSGTNLRAEIEKGNCVRRQLKMWEDLVEMRIMFQKCLTAGNIMPQYDTYPNYAQNPEFKKGSNEVKNKLSNLLGNLLELQSSLLSKFPETKHLSTDKKRKLEDEDEPDDPMDEEIPSDTDDETNEKVASGEDDEEEGSEESESEQVKGPAKKKLKLSEFEKIIAKNHQAYNEYRDTVIRTWNDKTRLASGVMSKGPTQPITRQIEFLLSNKDKLRKKTQLKRTNYEIIGKSPTLDDNDGRHINEYDTEIYDDNDFYQQILKEMIECKTAGIEDPIKLGQEWAKLQDMRKKMKRKIDTRATKGRRIRYDVHQKLVNFMGPITVFDTWTDHSKNELYSSLFGKHKSVSQGKQDNNPT